MGVRLCGQLRRLAVGASWEDRDGACECRLLLSLWAVWTLGEMAAPRAATVGQIPCDGTHKPYTGMICWPFHRSPIMYVMLTCNHWFTVEGLPPHAARIATSRCRPGVDIRPPLPWLVARTNGPLRFVCRVRGSGDDSDGRTRATTAEQLEAPAVLGVQMPTCGYLLWVLRSAMMASRASMISVGST